MRYFIDYRFDDKVNQFLPVGIWIQDMDDLGIDIHYPDETSDEYWEAMWVMNRLVEAGLNAPPDFLEFHQQRAGYKGMRSQIFEEEIDLNVDEFMRKTLKKYMAGGG
ncbi:MAG: hypothetical protein P9X24_02140 [Candidatus Hatepunaea meridiana]|nr:hypothetical protein [Candidatus Hatepunaea meridiana]